MESQMQLCLWADLSGLEYLRPVWSSVCVQILDNNILVHTYIDNQYIKLYCEYIKYIIKSDFEFNSQLNVYLSQAEPISPPLRSSRQSTSFASHILV